MDLQFTQEELDFQSEVSDWLKENYSEDMRERHNNSPNGSISRDQQRLFVCLKTPYKKYQLLHGHLFLEQKKSLRETKLRANIEQRLEVKPIPSPIHISLQPPHR